MFRKILLLFAPLFCLLALEVAFRLGVWEPLALGQSHAGTSIALKRSLREPAASRIDFVTLGSSRPLYGIDHKRLAESAKKHGFVHANLSLAGSHWMTIGILARWLQDRRPEVRGGIIALADADFAFPGNGTYELGLVEPFRDAFDSSWVAAHVPFEQGNLETYGVYSSLFAWRDDARNLIVNPSRIPLRIRYGAAPPPTDSLFANPESMGDMCNQDPASFTGCESLKHSVDPGVDLVQQCNQIRDVERDRPDFAELLSRRPLPDFMLRTRALIRNQIRGMHWKIPPVVVLMPVPGYTRGGEKDTALHLWALQILQPLAAAGEIHLLDATTFFEEGDQQECHYFFDFYHQNAAGRQRFSDWLIPRMESLLYEANNGT